MEWIFFAVQYDGTSDPIVLAVQAKHPDRREGSSRRSTLPVTTVREVYGVSKAWDLAGAIAVTSSEYSREAKSFADLKPDEISLACAEDVVEWVRRYRWNHDE